MFINREKIDLKLLEEVDQLAEMHEDEVSEVLLNFDPHHLLYLKASSEQSYAGYTAREDGKLVGYLGYWVGYHPHYSEMMAHQDIFFVHPQWRNNSLIGLKLIKFSEKDLKENYEVKLIIQGYTSRVDVSPLFRRLGYKEGGRIYKKEI